MIVEGKEIKCLDKGFVRLVEVMGTDSSIVQAARVSYGKGTKTVRQDRGLIRYLWRNNHTTPFEMNAQKYHVKAPLFVFRQWHRHRIGVSINEMSARYSVMVDEFYQPPAEDLRFQDQNNKQGSAQETVGGEEAAELLAMYDGVLDSSYRLYQNLLDRGVARELSRIVLPVSLYSEMYWQCNLKSLFAFAQLRSDPHAQKEIRVYSDAMLSLAEEFFPIAVEAFRYYSMGKVVLYPGDIAALGDLSDGARSLEQIADSWESYWESSRERDEFLAKLEKILEGR